MTVNERLKNLRIEKKLSQTEFAEKLNVSRSTLMLIEQGKREINIKIIEALNIEYSISADWLLFGEGTFTINDFKHLMNTYKCFQNIENLIVSYTQLQRNLLKLYSAKYNLPILHDYVVKTQNKVMPTLKKFHDKRVVINNIMLEYVTNQSTAVKNELPNLINSFIEDVSFCFEQYSDTNIPSLELDETILEEMFESLAQYQFNLSESIEEETSKYLKKNKI